MWEVSFQELLEVRVRSMPDNALFSGRTAAWLHGLDFSPIDPIEVNLPASSSCSHLAGVHVTRSDFTDSETCNVRELPATTPTRTIADLARRFALVEAIVIVDMALRGRLVSVRALEDWATTHPHHRGVRRLLQAAAMADGESESPMESRLRALLLASGLPAPRVQQRIHDNSGSLIARADLFDPQERVVLEYDGIQHRHQLAQDNRRQNRLVDAGYRVLRFTAGDILHRQATVIDLVRGTLAA